MQISIQLTLKDEQNIWKGNQIMNKWCKSLSGVITFCYNKLFMQDITLDEYRFRS